MAKAAPAPGSCACDKYGTSISRCATAIPAGAAPTWLPYAPSIAMTAPTVAGAFIICSGVN